MNWSGFQGTTRTKEDVHIYNNKNTQIVLHIQIMDSVLKINTPDIYAKNNIRYCILIAHMKIFPKTIHNV